MQKTTRIVQIFVSLLTLTLISVPAASAQKDKPTEIKSIKTAYTLYSDIAYVPNADKLQKLDIYAPKDETPKGGWPVYFYVHGGGFVRGDKAEEGPSLTAAKLALDHGYVMVSVNYRLGAKLNNEQVVDVKAAIRYIKANAAKWNLNKDCFIIGGPSAGGGLAAMAGVTGNSDKYEKELLAIGAADAKDDVLAVVDYAGNVNRGEGYQDTNVNLYIDAKDPAFFIRHGSADKNVAPAQSIALASTLEKAGVKVDFKIIEGAEHTLEGMNFYNLFDANEAYIWLKKLINK